MNASIIGWNSCCSGPDSSLNVPSSCFFRTVMSLLFLW